MRNFHFILFLFTLVIFCLLIPIQYNNIEPLDTNQADIIDNQINTQLNGVPCLTNVEATSLNNDFSHNSNGFLKSKMYNTNLTDAKFKCLIDNFKLLNLENLKNLIKMIEWLINKLNELKTIMNGKIQELGQVKSVETIPKTDQTY